MIRSYSARRFIFLLVLIVILPGKLWAQVWSEDFNGTGIPPGWIVLNDDNNYYYDDMPLDDYGWLQIPRYDTEDPDNQQVISTSVFEPADTADRWLITPAFMVTDSAMVFLWEDASLDFFYPEKIQVWVSPTGGATKVSFTDMVYEGNAGSDAYSFKWEGASLSDYYGQTIRVALRDNTYNGSFVLADNMSVEIWNYLDAGVEKIVFPDIAAAGTSVEAVIKNYGAVNINSVKLRYSVDYASPVEETFSGLNVNPLGTIQLLLGVPTAETTGTHTVYVEILEVNGMLDELLSNNTASKGFVAASTSVARAGLLEDFGSSSCAPCAGFSSYFDPLAIENGANDGTSDFNVIKYQMFYPTMDLSYNNESMIRSLYYGITGIPQYYINGGWRIHTSIPIQQDIDSCKSYPSFISISGSYSIEGDLLMADVTLLPHFSMTGNFSLYMAATQSHYTNLDNTSGQDEYYDVMRDMFPDGNGTLISEFSDGVPLHFKYKKHFDVGTVTAESHIFWSSPTNGSLVVFVQNNDNKEILQSKSFRIGGTGLNIPGNIVSNLQLYPNPTSGIASLSLSLEEKTNIKVDICDISGKKMATVYNKAAEQGIQSIPLPTAQLNSGTYLITVTTPNNRIVQKLSVIK